MSFYVDSPKRILKDITRDSFVIPKEFKLSDPSMQHMLSVEKFILGDLDNRNMTVQFTSKGMEMIRGKRREQYRAEDISQLYFDSYIVVKSSSRHYIEVLYYRLNAIIKNAYGQESCIPILDEISSEYFVRYVEQEAEKIMGIEDRPVNEEYDYSKKLIALNGSNDLSFESSLNRVYVYNMRKSVGSMGRSSITLSKQPYFLSVLTGNESLNIALGYLGFLILAVFIVLGTDVKDILNDNILFLTVSAIGCTAIGMFLYKLLVKNKYCLQIDGTSFSLITRNYFNSAKDIAIGSIFDIEKADVFDNRCARFQIEDVTNSRNNATFILNLKMKDGRTFKLFNGLSSQDAEEIAEVINRYLEYMQNDNRDF